MTRARHVRETLTLAYPVAIGQLGHVMLGLVDSIMVGRTGATPLAAAALVNALFHLLFVTGLGVSSAISPLVAIARGEERPEECAEILRHGAAVNASFGALFTIAGFGMVFLLPLLGQPAGVVREARPFLTLMSLLFVPMMLFHAARQYIEAMGDTRPPMYIVIAGNAVNIGLNWVLIYGNLGAPALGLTGSGISTLVTELLMATTILAFVKRARRFEGARPRFAFRRLDRARIRRILSIGLPGGGQMLFEVSAFSFSGIMVGWTGSVALAAHQIALSLASLTFMIILGISIATTIRVGTAHGRGERAELRRAGFTSIVLAAAVMAGFGVGMILLRDTLPQLYVPDTAVWPVAASLLLIAAAFQIMDGVQAVSMGALRGVTDVKVPMLISFVAYWVVSIPLGYIAGIREGLGVQGIWLGFVAGLLVAASAFAVRFARITKVPSSNGREEVLTD